MEIISMNREERRNSILRAAADVLLEAGIPKTTMGDIARRAGMAKTSLYYYFKDKEDLVKTIIHDEQIRILGMIECAVECQDTVESKMTSLMEVYYQFISRRAWWISKEVMTEYRPLSSMVPLDRDHYLLPLKDLIEHIMREGIRKGELRPMEDLDLVAWVILASMVGCEYLFTFHKRNEWVMGVIRSMVGTFFAGINKEATCN